MESIVDKNSDCDLSTCLVEIDPVHTRFARMSKALIVLGAGS
jgi:hypothetical protein